MTIEIDVLETQDEFSIPLDISDLLTICQEYSQLGHNIQYQVNAIMENGLERAVKLGVVKLEALPHIKSFLQAITRNAYFGDAQKQAEECISLIELYQETNTADRLSKN